MQRIIKFRAWDGEKMYEWKDSKESICWHLSGEMALNSGLSLNADIMQFTGLLDKNGKEIYEKDIIQFEVNGFNPMIDTNRAKVIFAEGGFVFDAGRFTSRGEPDYIHFGFWKDPEKAGLEVIGNIYENPELLT